MKKDISLKVLMVCLGNICRSPLAEGILQDMIIQSELPWEVDSAGTAGYHEGELPDRRSIDIAKHHGIDISKQRSRKLLPSDIRNYDKILAMDASNYNDILALCQNKEERSKVDLILNYSNPGMNPVVPDPYYEGGFDLVFDMLKDACREFINSERQQ